MTDYLTTRQVQSLLRVDRTTIYRMVEGGRLPAIRVGKQWRFSRSEVEQWLQASRSRAALLPAALPDSQDAPGPAMSRDQDLRSLLPLACVQLIQDTCAEMLGVMMVTTDMRGLPVTGISNPCGFFSRLTEKNPAVLGQCVSTWQRLAGDPTLAPRFSASEMQLLCARGLIRVGAELKGMVVLGGIAPDLWPPSEEQAVAMARAFKLEPDDVLANANAVYRLDPPAQERVLRFAQRIADIFSHIIEDRALAQAGPRPGDTRASRSEHAIQALLEESGGSHR